MIYYKRSEEKENKKKLLTSYVQSKAYFPLVEAFETKKSN